MESMYATLCNCSHGWSGYIVKDHRTPPSSSVVIYHGCVGRLLFQSKSLWANQRPVHVPLGSPSLLRAIWFNTFIHTRKREPVEVSHLLRPGLPASLPPSPRPAHAETPRRPGRRPGRVFTPLAARTNVW